MDFTLNFNNYNENVLNFYGFWSYRCPSCNAFHSFTRHATYSRNICFFYFGRIEEHKINILRLLCNSCDTTHAILPADTVPYLIYSFSCIICILIKRFVNEESILEISNKNQISYQLIYLFLKRFITHFNPCITFLRVFLAVQLEFSSPFKDVVSTIVMHFNIIDFQRKYLNYSKLVFLMMRKQNILSKPVHIGAHFKPPT